MSLSMLPVERLVPVLLPLWVPVDELLDELLDDPQQRELKLFEEELCPGPDPEEEYEFLSRADKFLLPKLV